MNQDQLQPQHSNICWHDDGQRCDRRHHQASVHSYGCVQCAGRWFWVISNAHPLSDPSPCFYGWVDTEATAFAEMYQALVELADMAEDEGVEIVAVYNPDYAASNTDWEVESDELGILRLFENRVSTPMTKAEINAEFDWLIEEGLIEYIGESTRMTKAEVDAGFDWLIEEGLIEHDGTYRHGHPVYIISAKGHEYLEESEMEDN